MRVRSGSFRFLAVKWKFWGLGLRFEIWHFPPSKGGAAQRRVEPLRKDGWQ